MNAKSGQYFNLQAIKLLLISLLTNRKLFNPHVRAKSVKNIDYKKLRESGIRYVIFDKDNTLTLPYDKQYYS